MIVWGSYRKKTARQRSPNGVGVIKQSSALMHKIMKKNTKSEQDGDFWRFSWKKRPKAGESASRNELTPKP
jgi:hypothetical protein